MKKVAIIMLVAICPLIGFSQKANDKGDSEKGNDLLVIPESFKFDIDKFKNRDFSLREAIEKQVKKSKSNMPVFKPEKIPHIMVLDIDSTQIGFLIVHPPWWSD